MWKTFLYRRRLKKILVDKKLNRRRKCLKLLELLSGEDLKKTDSLAALKLSVLYNNIATYIKKIKEVNYYLDRKVIISSDILSNNPVIVIFDSFFTDSDNYYVEVSKSFDIFKTECVKMLTLLEESDSAEHGYYEHALRMLTTVLLNLEEAFVRIAISCYG